MREEMSEMSVWNSAYDRRISEQKNEMDLLKNDELRLWRVGMIKKKH